MQCDGKQAAQKIFNFSSQHSGRTRLNWKFILHFLMNRRIYGTQKGLFCKLKISCRVIDSACRHFYNFAVNIWLLNSTIQKYVFLASCWSVLVVILDMDRKIRDTKATKFKTRKSSFLNLAKKHHFFKKKNSSILDNLRQVKIFFCWLNYIFKNSLSIDQFIQHLVKVSRIEIKMRPKLRKSFKSAFKYKQGNSFECKTMIFRVIFHIFCVRKRDF